MDDLHLLSQNDAENQLVGVVLPMNLAVRFSSFIVKTSSVASPIFS